jgi:hypothetical protein
MGRDHTEQPIPDLFSTEKVRDASQPLPTPSQNKPTTNVAHVLPKDLKLSIKHLSDKDLDRLFEAVFDETKRRGRLPWTVGDEPSAAAHKEKIAEPSLTTGQLRAIRASVKAGIKPSHIARQFGVSLADVRKALASK